MQGEPESKERLERVVAAGDDVRGGSIESAKRSR